MQAPVIIYDLNLKKMAYLQNAFNVGYEQRFNELWTAQFSLPLTDPKNAECLPLRFVEIFDGDQRVDLFRIIPTATIKSESDRVITYRCEHILATLLDDVMFQYHEIGGTGVFTTAVLEYILARQTVARWQLGTVGFARQFLYKWENENLLGALFSVPRPFAEEYRWTWDTSEYPWTLNLVGPDDDPGPEIRYHKNLRGVEKEEDPTHLCTRLYPLGYGEGVNQLTIESEHPEGKSYIDADTQSTYGIISRVWVDRRHENAEILYNAALAMLEALKIPRISYKVEGADLYQVSRDPLERFRLGANVRVVDEELGIDFTARVVGLSKADVVGAPGDIGLEIANAPEDIAGSIAELANRTRINEVYAQGATNLDSHNFADNCDPDYPAVMRFYVPEETVRINKMLLSYQSEAFRAYSRAVAGGGAHSDTVAAGGAYSDTTPSGGGHTSGASSQTTTPSAGEHKHIMFVRGGSWTPGYSGRSTSTPMTELDWHNHTDLNQPHDHNTGFDYYSNISTENHRHVITWDLIDAWFADGDVSVGIPASELATVLTTWEDAGEHTHGMAHTHTVQNHTHGYSVPNHQHGFSIPDHEHQIEHGIFQGPSPTVVVVKVDGNTVPDLGTSETDVDIVPYLAKDEGGRIQRGWHEITITPDNLGRIVANVVSQFFVQSRGGGDF